MIQVPTVATKDDEILVPGSINGRPVTFMVDSGATSVGIPLLIAKKLDLGPALDFVTVSFADGRTAVHTVYGIASLRIGDAEIHDVRATVGGDGDYILLGRSALNNFASWAVDTRKGMLILHR
jgi:aspartyl protease family protein